MKYILAFFGVLFLASSALASPFVSCDTMTCDGFRYSLDGGVWQTVAYQTMVADSDGQTYAAILDGAPLTPGPHSIAVKPYEGEWEGDEVIYDFTKPDLGPPTNLQVRR